MSRLPFRSVFVSDVHLGLRDCQAGYLLDFLRSMQCERLYLVGDIVDFESMQKKPFWHASHGDVLAEIFAIVARGTLVASQGKGQSVELQAGAVTVLGWVDDPETYPIQPKRHTVEYLAQQVDPAARRVGLGAIELIGGAGGQTKSTVDTRIGQLANVH